ncbi:hypothetical protein [Actinophytocola sp.]|uniref:hypothetical protein n=1 Tax=Actinophytocola sp. TaxID=1872138 RepID=UPI003899C7FC
MDEDTAENNVKELRSQVYALRNQVTRLEIAVFRAVVAIGATALVLGYFVPFLTATEKAGEDDSIGLLAAVFGLGGSGDGPFSEEAAMAAIVVGVFALAILVALIALLRLFGNQVGSRPVRFARVCGIILLVACGFGWLLVFALAGHFAGRVSAFSPATLSFTIGGAATLLAAALHPTDWRI